MRIGLDIDNVITDFDYGLIKEILIEDKNKRNRGIINPKAKHIVNGMFDWSREEVNEFFAQNMQRIAKSLSPRRNCKKIIDRLVDEGNEIFLISHRAYPDYTEPFEVTIDWLERHEIKYNKLILSQSPDKSPECKEFNIDVMVDDRVGQCKKMRENGVNCIVMKTRYNKREKHDLPVATSWNNLYEELQKCKKKI